ncbi:MAG: Hpt domain-containing protein [bacterium]
MAITTVQETEAVHEHSVQAVDPEEVLDRVDGDLEFLQELAELFFDSSEELLEELQSAIASGDTVSVGTAAHTLKGAVGNFGAMRAFNLALELEKMGKNGMLDQAKAVSANLEAELQEVKTQIQKILQ